jgi:hypothetical protein
VLLVRLHLSARRHGALLLFGAVQATMILRGRFTGERLGLLQGSGWFSRLEDWRPSWRRA